MWWEPFKTLFTTGEAITSPVNWSGLLMLRQWFVGSENHFQISSAYVQLFISRVNCGRVQCVPRCETTSNTKDWLLHLLNLGADCALEERNKPQMVDVSAAQTCRFANWSWTCKLFETGLGPVWNQQTPPTINLFASDQNAPNITARANFRCTNFKGLREKMHRANNTNRICSLGISQTCQNFGGHTIRSLTKSTKDWGLFRRVNNPKYKTSINMHKAKHKYVIIQVNCPP